MKPRKFDVRLLNTKMIEDALNECFDHDLIYKGIIQIFPNSIYNIDGKKVLELYEKLNLKNEARKE